MKTERTPTSQKKNVSFAPPAELSDTLKMFSRSDGVIDDADLSNMIFERHQLQIIQIILAVRPRGKSPQVVMILHLMKMRLQLSARQVVKKLLSDFLHFSSQFESCYFAV